MTFAADYGKMKGKLVEIQKLEAVWSGDVYKRQQYEELYAALEEFFGKLRYKLEYSDDKLNFWLSNE